MVLVVGMQVNMVPLSEYGPDAEAGGILDVL